MQREMLDVTPARPALAVPDVPSIPRIPEIEPAPARDGASYLSDLTDALAVAKGQPALIAEIANEHEANAGDLDADTQQKAQALIDAAE